VHLNNSYKLLICDAHSQLLWWNIAVGNFTPKQNLLLTTVLFCNELLVIDKCISQTPFGMTEWAASSMLSCVLVLMRQIVWSNSNKNTLLDPNDNLFDIFIALLVVKICNIEAI